MSEAALRARIAELEAALREAESLLPWSEPDGSERLEVLELIRAVLSRAEPAPPPPPPHLREPGFSVWTAERVALLKRTSQAQMAMNPITILVALNDLPGPPIGSFEAVQTRWEMERSRGAA